MPGVLDTLVDAKEGALLHQLFSAIRDTEPIGFRLAGYFEKVRAHSSSPSFFSFVSTAWDSVSSSIFSLCSPLFAHSSVPTPHVVLHICQVIRKLYQRKSMRIVTYLDEHGTDLLRRAFVLPTCVILLLAALPHARLPTPSDTQRPRLTSRISRLLAYPRGAPLSGWCRLRPTVA